MGCACNALACRRQDPQRVGEPDEQAANKAAAPGPAQRPRFAHERVDDPHHQPHAQMKGYLDA